MNEIPIPSLIAFVLLGGGYLVLQAFIIKWTVKFAIEVIKHW